MPRIEFETQAKRDAFFNNWLRPLLGGENQWVGEGFDSKDGGTFTLYEIGEENLRIHRPKGAENDIFGADFAVVSENHLAGLKKFAGVIFEQDKIEDNLVSLASQAEKPREYDPGTNPTEW